MSPGIRIPEGTEPGQLIHVKHPTDGRIVSAIIPLGCAPGQTMHVQFPATPTTTSAVTAVTAVLASPTNCQGTPMEQEAMSPSLQSSGSPNDGYRPWPSNKATNGITSTNNTNSAAVPKKFKRCSEEMMLLNEKGLAKVRAPAGMKAGDSFHVRIADGRTIQATIPSSVAAGDYFFVKVPAKKQNFHDNPVAVAPMVLGPLLM